MGYRLRLSLACILTTACCMPASGAKITVLLSEDGPAYVEAGEAFKSYLAKSAPGAAAVDIVPLGSIRNRPAALRDSALIVTVGVAAAEAALAAPSDAPVLGALIPKAAFEALACNDLRQRAPRRCSAVFLDQPIDRQLALIRAAFPERLRLGAVLGPASESSAPMLGEAARRHGLSLEVRTVKESADLYRALESVLAESDVLLAVPDRAVLTTSSARSLLISAYRDQVPVAAFSESYVTAGATLAVYSTPQQIGRQAAEAAAGFLSKDPAELPAPRYPKYFSVKVNQQVARSLGLAIPDEQTLHDRITEAGE